MRMKWQLRLQLLRECLRARVRHLGRAIGAERLTLVG